MVISGTGVIFLKRTRRVSRQMGTYLSNRICRLAFSDWTSRVSIQLDTYLQKRKDLNSLAGSEAYELNWITKQLYPTKLVTASPAWQTVDPRISLIALEFWSADFVYAINCSKSSIFSWDLRDHVTGGHLGFRCTEYSLEKMFTVI